MNRRLRALLRKEYKDLVKNKAVVLPMVLTPLILLVNFLPGVLLMAGGESNKKSLGIPIPDELMHLDPLVAMVHQLNDMAVMMLMLTPATMPMMIASFSIVGEKRLRSLEPLLASPIRTGELLLAKALAAAVLPLIIGWASMIIYVAVVAVGTSAEITAWIVRPANLMAMVLLTPTITLLSTLVAVAASSRAQDPRAAQLWVMVLAFPILGLSSSSFVGVVLTTGIMAATLVVAVVATVAMYRLAVWLFQREVIITRWS